MRALIVLAGAALMSVSAFAADTQVKQSPQGMTKIVVASADMRQVQRAPKAVKTDAPVRVWSLEMSCCEAQ